MGTSFVRHGIARSMLLAFAALVAGFAHAQSAATGGDARAAWDTIHAGMTDSGLGDGSQVMEVYIGPDAPEPYRSLYLRWVGKLSNAVQSAIAEDRRQSANCRVEFSVDSHGLSANPAPACVRFHPPGQDGDPDHQNVVVATLERLAPPRFTGDEGRRYHLTVDFDGQGRTLDYLNDRERAVYVVNVPPARGKVPAAVIPVDEQRWILQHRSSSRTCSGPPYTLTITADAPGALGGYLVDWINRLEPLLEARLPPDMKGSASAATVAFFVDKGGLSQEFASRPVPQPGQEASSGNALWSLAVDALKGVSPPPFLEEADLLSQVDTINILVRLELRKGGRIEIGRGAELLEPMIGMGCVY